MALLSVLVFTGDSKPDIEGGTAAMLCIGGSGVQPTNWRMVQFLGFKMVKLVLSSSIMLQLMMQVQTTTSPKIFLKTHPTC